MRDRQATAGRTAHTAQPGPRPHAGCLVRYCGALLRALALRAIGLYQRHLSPRKGFACAYRARTGGASCSELGFRAIRRFGLRARPAGAPALQRPVSYTHLTLPTNREV